MYLVQISYLNTYLSILLLLIMIVYLVITTIQQIKLIKKNKWIFAFIIPTISSVFLLLLVRILNINFWILLFFDYAYYILIYFVKIENSKGKSKDNQKVDIKDL